MKKLLKRRLKTYIMVLLAMSGVVTLMAQETRPNVLFFYIDDLGWTDLGVYGSDFYETPSIDKLAQQGVRFTAAYQGSARCVPSRKSLFTGKYHERPEIADGSGVNLSELTFAEALQDAGYRTFFTGKWHLGKDSTRFPDKQGFDVNKAGCAWGAPQGSLEGGGYYYSPYACPTLSDGPEGEYLTDRLTRETIDFIVEHQQSSPDVPFLACVFHYAVHTPIEAPESYVAYYRDKLAGMDYARPEKEIDGPAKTNLRHDHPVYAGMIASVDGSVRMIREKLDELGLSDNTIIVFSTDHGGLSSTLKSSGREIATSNYPLRTGKGWLYEGGIRSPLIVYWPGSSQPGMVSDETVLAMDIYPTLLEMTGLPLQPQQHLDGQSFAPLLMGEDWTRSEPIMWYFPFAKTGTGNPNMAALRDGDKKLIHFQHQDRFELYDLSRDISESYDLANEEPELLEQMKQQLFDIQVQTGMPPVSQSRIILEEEEILPEYKVSVSPDALPKFMLDLLETDIENAQMKFTLSVSEENSYVHPVDLQFHYRPEGEEEWIGFVPTSGDYRHLLPGSYVSTWDYPEIEAEVVDIRISGNIQNALDPESLGEVIRTDLQLKKKGPVQIGFFEDYWSPKTAEHPDDIPMEQPVMLPETMISVDLADTLGKISPYIGGYSLNTYYGGKIHDKPGLMRHIHNIDLPFFRYPGGSGSLWYFWDHAKPNLPDSVDYLTIKEETSHIADKIRWGDIPGTDYLSLDNSYILRSQLGTEGIHVVNYALARYGRHQDPVAAAAHYAADWVRYDNGRTKFWEIGNEIYGSWEPSWIIDTSRNLDGQPRQITGTLYAEHCQVFLDSMRAAAAEIGSEIRIGATLGFQESRTSWDQQVLQELGNQVDFYIVHKYFGNGQDAAPAELFSSIDEFYQHMSHVNALIDQYCETDVPLVLTEWNTRYSGSQQNVSCANGMHTLLGYKAIINEGIGLSSKWNLIWGYQNGETHGLISGEKDNPAIEGIPAFFPRAPFMYQYYFKKFLGDVSVNTRFDHDLGLDVFSSQFSSGEAGITILNKSGEERKVVVNLENFNYGERYYSYTLTPPTGALYDRKVEVNGLGNEIYDAGGPLNYEEIPAYSYAGGQGIRLDLPPFSTTYILAEGSFSEQASDASLNFRIHSRKDNEVSLLKNAVVRIGEKMYLTDINGEVQTTSGLGTLDYKLLAHGHDTLISSIEVKGSMLIQDTLDFTKYEVSFEISDAETKLPLSDGYLTLGTQSVPLTPEGSASFSDVSYGSYELLVRSKAYKESIPLEVYSDTLFQLQLTKTLYDASFLVRDVVTGDPVNNAVITCNGKTFYTNLEGEAFSSDTFGLYDLSVEAPNYRLFSEQITLQNDTIIKIDLSLAAAHVKFKVYKGASPVNNAEVRLNGEIKLTNAIGIVNYYDLPTGISYDYSVTDEDYGILTGSINLLADTTLSLNYENAIVDIGFQVIDNWTLGPVEASQVVFNQIFKQADADGRVSYQFPPGTYDLTVNKDRYAEYTTSIELSRDTSIQVSLNLMSAIIRFRVHGQDGVLGGASVAFAEDSRITNSIGIAVFSDITVGETYQYSVSKDDYDTRSSAFTVVHDSLLEVHLFPTALDGQSFPKPRVYPNPAKSRITVEVPFRMRYVELIDLNGRLCELEWNMAGKHAEANIVSLSPGMYFIVIHDENDRIEYARIMVTPGI